MAALPAGWPERELKAAKPTGFGGDERARPSYHLAAADYHEAARRATGTDPRGYRAAAKRLDSMRAEAIFAESVYGEQLDDPVRLADGSTAGSRLQRVESAREQPLPDWLEQLSIGAAAIRAFHQSGFETVDDVLKARLSDADLRLLGVHSVSERHSVLHAISQARRDGMSIDTVSAALVGKSLQSQFENLALVSARDQAEKQIIQAKQQAKV